MTLRALLEGVNCKHTFEDRVVTSIARDSRQVKDGCVFFCIKGEKSDGHGYAQGALEAGAAAVVVERDMGLANQVIVEDTHLAYAAACAGFFGNPARGMKLIGVTGTNGKTTITYLVKQILTCAGAKAGLIGTIHNEIGDTVIPAKHTTPDPFQLHAMLARMAEAGCEYVVMEVSSHALDQKRVEGLRFAAAAFTNLTQDHLDYHKDMESYYQAKKKLFSMCDTAVINADDEYGRRLCGEITCNTLTYACERRDANYTAHDILFSASGSRFTFLAGDKLAKVNFVQPGLFSVSNAMAAAVLCLAAGIGLDAVMQGLNSCKGVPGRFEILPTNTPYTVIRDYAHSPDGLEKLLTTIRAFAPNRVVTLFGCAGNRDRTKRPLMAEAAARLSDFCIITSDNPRDEEPHQIINDALPGIKQHRTPYRAIADRYEAIRWALKNSQPDDILVLAGKGHEDYQVLDYGTIYFDEREIVLGMLGIKES
ncbi:MAG: UDP-N-acetylmuramoyl-L-alanyl-D-glutamate--2,6-diaminopimelate ligase [Oscillospiraceae bacterium]|nr:UDP-N-acetylmuramoyl-L-alanyl-D-glutamate--2,6-diaminopimelate ligase [Oscillospiraceae bacterium]